MLRTRSRPTGWTHQVHRLWERGHHVPGRNNWIDPSIVPA